MALTHIKSDPLKTVTNIKQRPSLGDLKGEVDKLRSERDLYRKTLEDISELFSLHTDKRIACIEAEFVINNSFIDAEIIRKNKPVLPCPFCKCSVKFGQGEAEFPEGAIYCEIFCNNHECSKSPTLCNVFNFNQIKLSEEEVFSIRWESIVADWNAFCEGGEAAVSNLAHNGNLPTLRTVVAFGKDSTNEHIKKRILDLPRISR